jgi:acyl-CoA synthetase (AMP-forming)/AMP-acid ligase II
MVGYQSYADLMAASSEDAPIAPAISGDDPYNIIYSSGTTGLPKGIVISHFARSMYAMQYAAAYRFTPESIALHTGSLVFNGAFLTLMPSFYLGSTYILHRQFNAEAFIATVAREKVTHVKMVPSQIVAVLHSPDFSPEKLASLEMIGSVGAPLHMEHKEALNAALPGRFYELYGLTEGFMTILDKEDYAAKPTSVGTPLPFFEMGIMDENGRLLPPNEIGEIVGKSPQLMSGYYKRPDLTAQTIRDGWLHSGDVGYVDEDGFLYLVDRYKDMIISGGVNVYPRDIEEVIVQHEAVLETAVFGIPSDKWGETPLAAVILKTGATINEDALKTWINARVGARYQRIHGVVFHDDFPRSAAGKTLKRLLRELYWVNRNVSI